MSRRGHRPQTRRAVTLEVRLGDTLHLRLGIARLPRWLPHAMLTTLATLGTWLLAR